MTKKLIPTYCKGCSFSCAASDCECKCHDRMEKYRERLEKKLGFQTGGKQRKGQFLWNELAGKIALVNIDFAVSTRLWNISDEDFDKIMKKWKEL